MTSHEFANRLLQGPNLPILIPKVKEYSDDEEDCCADPFVVEEEGRDFNDNPCRVLVIDRRNDTPRLSPDEPSPTSISVSNSKRLLRRSQTSTEAENEALGKALQEILDTDSHDSIQLAIKVKAIARAALATEPREHFNTIDLADKLLLYLPPFRDYDEAKHIELRDRIARFFDTQLTRKEGQ